MAAFKKMSFKTTDDSMRSENHTDAKVSYNKKRHLNKVDRKTAMYAATNSGS